MKARGLLLIATVVVSLQLPASAQQQVAPNPYSPVPAGNPVIRSQPRPHYNGPMHDYTGWFRPRAVGRPRAVRCAPDDFRPKGFGHLFARPYTPYRMDYTPYKISDWSTPYGPSYYLRGPDERCPCDHCANGGCCLGCLKNGGLFGKDGKHCPRSRANGGPGCPECDGKRAGSGGRYGSGSGSCTGCTDARK